MQQLTFTPFENAAVNPFDYFCYMERQYAAGLTQVVRKWLVFPAPLVVPIVLLWLKIRMHSQETGKEAEL
jgi:hypothetical protein